MAERGFAFYVNRDLSQFMTTAGALDTVCVDKETSGQMCIRDRPKRELKYGGLWRAKSPIV